MNFLRADRQGGMVYPLPPVSPGGGVEGRVRGVQSGGGSNPLSAHTASSQIDGEGVLSQRPALPFCRPPESGLPFLRVVKEGPGRRLSTPHRPGSTNGYPPKRNPPPPPVFSPPLILWLPSKRIDGGRRLTFRLTLPLFFKFQFYFPQFSICSPRDVVTLGKLSGVLSDPIRSPPRSCQRSDWPPFEGDPSACLTWCASPPFSYKFH